MWIFPGSPTEREEFLTLGDGLLILDAGLSAPGAGYWLCVVILDAGSGFWPWMLALAVDSGCRPWVLALRAGSGC